MAANRASRPNLEAFASVLHASSTVSLTPLTSTRGDICARAYDKGLVIETSGNEDQVVKVLAPLTTSPETFGQGFDILLEAARETLTETTNIAAE